METSNIEIRLANNLQDYSNAKELILEYVTWLGDDLSFQNFDQEIKKLSEMYGQPSGGLLMASIDDNPIAVAGVRKFTDKDCEIKRMFVKPEFRGLGIGKLLLHKCIALAKELEYETIKLDTVDFMKSAIKLYTEIGFVEIAAYRYNPYEDARYFEFVIKEK